MIAADARRRFEAMVASAGGDSRALAAGLRRETTGIGLKALSALALHAAVSTPERLGNIYDGAAEGWWGEKVAARPLLQPAAKPAPIPPALWDSLWDLLEVPPDGLGAAELTQRIAELCDLVGAGLYTRLAACPLSFPGAREAIAQGYPTHFSREALSRFPADTLAGEFCHHVGDRGLSLEILDRDSLGLAQLPPSLAYVNARILQCHDLWHIVAGYETTTLHEVAISAFQMAQFGHHYSSMFTAICLMRVAFQVPEGAALMLDTILGAWIHGRTTPPLLGVNWDAQWDRPLSAVRGDLGVKPFTSPYPADLFEKLAQASAAA